jgi:hypothetical protein
MCECGSVKIVTRANVKNGTTKSCGSNICSRNIKHGIFRGKVKNKNRTDEYVIWDNLRRRCTVGSIHNKKGNYSKIENPISQDWLSFEYFLNDMGLRPSKKHSIERIDNDKGYFKENCKWATQHEQMRNQSRNVNFMLDGEKLCYSDLCKRLNLNHENGRYYRRKSDSIFFDWVYKNSNKKVKRV